MSTFWQELFYLHGTKLKASSSYHSQTDGQTEVMNMTIEQYLRYYYHEEQTRWKEYIPWVEYWYKTSNHASIRMSPFEVTYERKPPILCNYQRGMIGNEEVEQELVARDEILAFAKRTLEKAQCNMKKYYDQDRRKVVFELGDYVYIKL